MTGTWGADVTNHVPPHALTTSRGEFTSVNGIANLAATCAPPPVPSRRSQLIVIHNGGKYPVQGAASKGTLDLHLLGRDRQIVYGVRHDDVPVVMGVYSAVHGATI